MSLTLDAVLANPHLLRRDDQEGKQALESEVYEALTNLPYTGRSLDTHNLQISLTCGGVDHVVQKSIEETRTFFLRMGTRLILEKVLHHPQCLSKSIKRIHTDCLRTIFSEAHETVSNYLHELKNWRKEFHHFHTTHHNFDAALRKIGDLYRPQKPKTEEESLYFPLAKKEQRRALRYLAYQLCNKKNFDVPHSIPIRDAENREYFLSHLISALCKEGRWNEALLLAYEPGVCHSLLFEIAYKIIQSKPKNRKDLLGRTIDAIHFHVFSTHVKSYRFLRLRTMIENDPELQKLQPELDLECVDGDGEEFFILKEVENPDSEINIERILSSLPPKRQADIRYKIAILEGFYRALA